MNFISENDEEVKHVKKILTSQQKNLVGLTDIGGPQ
jgi:hypothetical protein